jgi:hypothetical protein
MRSYFLDPKATAKGFELYVWPYASDEIVIVRSTGLIHWGVHDMILGDVLKFFPLAFWLVYHAPSDLEYPFARIPLDQSLELDAEATLEIPLAKIPTPTWPERPRNWEFVLNNSERSHVGSPSPPLRRSPMHRRRTP